MFLSRDNHRRFTGSQCRANKSAQLVKKKSVVPVELNYVCGVVVVSPGRLWRGRKSTRNRSVRDTHVDQLLFSRHLAPTWNESRMATVWVILVCKIISAHTGNPVLVSRSLCTGTTKRAVKSLQTLPRRQPNWLLAIPSSSRYRNFHRLTWSRSPSLWRSTRDEQPIADWPR